MIADTSLRDLLPVAVYMTDAQGRITYYNEGAAELWGNRPELGRSQWCGSWRLLRPNGTPLPHDECPMAITLKEGRAVRGIDAIAERPDGTRVPFRPFPTPLRDGAGNLIGAINLLIDIGDRIQADIESARLAAIVVSSDDAIISKTLEGRVTSWNGGAERIFGYTAEEMVGQSILRIIPPELHDEEYRILAQLKRGEPVSHFETVRVAKNGRRIDISLTVSPMRDRYGNLIGASKVARDISERKQAETLQRMLVEELNHRVKNTLATVQAIASQSLRHAKRPADFVASFSGRVQALAQAHMLLTQARMQGTELMDLIREQVLLGGADDTRVTCSGPMLILDAQTTLHLALVLHELATNARKYGALAMPQGQLAVTWETRCTGSEEVLLLLWKEHSDVNIKAPRERGYGSTLIEQTLRSHGGKASIRYRTHGITCEIELPLQNEVRSMINVCSPEPATEADLSGARRVERSVKGKRILVIEDEPLISMDLEVMLESEGCVVVGPAMNFETAKSLIGTEQFDAALLDVNLAGHSVDELAAALTQKACPFAFVTGYGRSALPLGFRDALVLSKPFVKGRLIATIGVLLFPRDHDVVPFRQKRS
jgi:PAS domain S-box-containing protein